MGEMFVQIIDLFAQSESIEVTSFDFRMLAVVRFLRISSIHLLELINGQALFKNWLYVFYFSNEFVGVLFSYVCQCLGPSIL